MITRFRRFIVLALLILSSNAVCWGATSKNPPASLAPRDAARNQVVERLQNAIYPVKLVLRDRTKVEGRVTKTSTDRFTLQTLEGSGIVERTIRFDEVKKVSYIIPGHDTVKMLTGTLVGSAILAVIILAAVGAL